MFLKANAANPAIFSLLFNKQFSRPKTATLYVIWPFVDVASLPVDGREETSVIHKLAFL
jgi:hypothetical protein